MSNHHVHSIHACSMCPYSNVLVLKNRQFPTPSIAPQRDRVIAMQYLHIPCLPSGIIPMSSHSHASIAMLKRKTQIPSLLITIDNILMNSADLSVSERIRARYPSGTLYLKERPSTRSAQARLPVSSLQSLLRAGPRCSS